MPELTREEKLKLVEKLPQRLQDFLYSEDTGAFLIYVGQKYKLSDEKVSALSKIVFDIIVKITPITSLAQEIVGKVISDPQTAMIVAQELNNDLLTPVLIMPAPAISPPMPVPPSAAPQTQAVPPRPAPPQIQQFQAPNTDKYREPTAGAPEIVDLRKMPPPPIPMPVAAAPIPARQQPESRLQTPEASATGGQAQAMAGEPPTPKPLTFTKPVEKLTELAKPAPTPSLIEADPHKIIENAPKLPENPEAKPQFIIRPPGLAPTDMPHNILDLKKDKGQS